MKYTNVVVEVMFESAKLIDQLELWAELSLEEARFLAAYQAKFVANGNTNSTDDLKFKAIFDRWFIYNMA